MSKWLVVVLYLFLMASSIPGCVPGPSPTATSTATAIPTATTNPTSTPAPTATATPTAAPTATSTPTATPKPTATVTPTSVPTQAPAPGQGLVPGQTICDPVLQQDVLWYVMLYEDALGGGCSNSRVVDTQVVEPPVEGRWAERWTVDRCGTPIHYRIEFIANPDGGTDFVVGLDAG